MGNAPQGTQYAFEKATESALAERIERIDLRSTFRKIRDGIVSVIFSPTVAFNAANIAFSLANDNMLATAISSTMGCVSAASTFIDEWRGKPQSSSYQANAAYQGVMGLTYIPRLATGDWSAAKEIALYGLATTGHLLRAREEEEAAAQNLSMDEYYQSFKGGPVKYSQTYYGGTEMMAIGAVHNPSIAALGIAGAGIGRALTDQKFWDLKGPLKPLREATAPRIFSAGYAVSTAAAVASGDYAYAASQLGWGWGNANFDWIGPKVKKWIKRSDNDTGYYFENVMARETRDALPKMEPEDWTQRNGCVFTVQNIPEEPPFKRKRNHLTFNENKIDSAPLNEGTVPESSLA